MAYNLLKPVHLINAASMAISITSEAQEIQNQDNIGIQLNWTGTPTGPFAIQISADHLQDIEGNIQVAGHWITLPLSPAISASGSPDSAYIDLNQMSARYMRIVYTSVSGAGTLDAFVMAKGV